MSDYRISYCTNVHAGSDLQTTRTNLEQHALAVRRHVEPDGTLGIGLWLSAQAAQQLRDERALETWQVWLQENGLLPFTLNGFPYGDFHQPVVKHKVYLPTWSAKERLDYTLDLIEILDQLLPPDMEGSISTLPLQWGEPAWNSEQRQAAITNLLHVVDALHRKEQQTGRLIYLCLEPEPGCRLQRSEDVVSLFQNDLWPAGNEELICRYLRVCHDICHAAVMFEEQRHALEGYRSAGIRVGKIQVSSAVVLPLSDLPAEAHQAALGQLAAFAEDRYLHQTSVRSQPDRPPAFFEDLPQALAVYAAADQPTDQWRVHFHIPIYLQQFGHLTTSQAEIVKCLSCLDDFSEFELQHLEVETYAWNVLPEALRQPTLANGIAEEIRWLKQHLAKLPLNK